MNKFIEFEDEFKFWAKAKELIVSSPTSNIGISGGSASKVLEHLSNYFRKSKKWWLVDERKVGIKDENSNCAWIYSLVDDIDIECPWHDKDFEKKLPDQLDLVVMGVGPDGHIGSLFSEDDILENGKLVNTETKEFEVNERISLSMHYLLKAKKVIVLLQGDAKKNIWLKMKNLDSQKKGTDSPIEFFMKNFKGEFFGLYLR